MKEKTKPVVINCCYGGFSLSPEATLWLYSKGAKIEVVPVKEWFRAGFDKPEFEYGSYKKGS